MKYFDRTTVDPNIMGGRPCIRNTRVTVALILNLLSNSLSFDDIISDYPELDKTDILAALKYAEWATSETLIIPNQ
jgi:uncharacterized protein (DUF433 family)